MAFVSKDTREREGEGGERERDGTLGGRTKTHLNAFESLSIIIHILHAHAHAHAHTCTVRALKYWECHWWVSLYVWSKGNDLRGREALLRRYSLY